MKHFNTPQALHIAGLFVIVVSDCILIVLSPTIQVKSALSTLRTPRRLVESLETENMLVAIARQSHCATLLYLILVNWKMRYSASSYISNNLLYIDNYLLLGTRDEFVKKMRVHPLCRNTFLQHESFESHNFKASVEPTLFPRPYCVCMSLKVTKQVNLANRTRSVVVSF